MFIAPYDDPYTIAGQVRRRRGSSCCDCWPGSVAMCPKPQGMQQERLAFSYLLPSHTALTSSRFKLHHLLCLQGTIGNEILRQCHMDSLDAIFVAVSLLLQRTAAGRLWFRGRGAGALQARR